MDNHILSILCILLVLLPVSASAKTGSTVYTPDRVANARHNIERYEWARKMRDNAVREAGAWARQSDEFLWDLVTPQSIPRSTEVNREHGCPNCGSEIQRFGNYPWKCDVIGKPWKVQCPSCGEVFPKNDFGRFYESGKDENGVFHPEKADRSLLFNSDHPDPSDPLHTYGVDDGMGWVDKDGSKYTFIAYYGHYGAWHAVSGALTDFRDAYVYTGDVRYARKAGLMLYRIAQFYPEMDWAPLAKLKFYNSDGGSGKGKIYGRIWETGLANTFVSTYDAVYPALDDQEMLQFLSAKAGRPVTVTDVRGLVEKNIVREVHDGIIANQIAGNEGMHQYSMALAAIVLDEPETTQQWLDWLFAPGDVPRGNSNGGGILDIFRDKIDDDGMGNEASPGYNAIWRGKFRAIADLLALYPRYKGPKIVEFPKYRKMFETPVRLICLGSYIPNIGDCGKTGNPGRGGIEANELAYAYRLFRDPVLAQMACFLNGGTAEGIHLDIFDSDPEGVVKEMEAEVRKHGPYVLKTESLASYGLAILRSGRGKDQRALTLYYGRNAGHGHKDTLNIELFGHGLDLMPDLGYPEYATVWPSRYLWTSNTISHNTVVVDRSKQGENRLGEARFVKEGEGVSAAEVCAAKPYPQTSLYQRTIAMVDVSDKDFYVVDIFRVRGGEEHHYSLHGPEGEIETEGLKLLARKGTLMGEDVPFEGSIGEPGTWGNAGGFQYLYDIRRDTDPPAQSAVTWKVKDTWNVLKEPKDVRFRIDILKPPGEVVLAHGDPPKNKTGNPRRLEYLVLPHKGGSSTFVTVLEPYEGSRAIRSIERADDGDTVRLKITLASGWVDYIVSAVKPGKLSAGSRAIDGRFCVVTEEDGRSEARLVAQ